MSENAEKTEGAAAPAAAFDPAALKTVEDCEAKLAELDGVRRAAEALQRAILDRKRLLEAEAEVSAKLGRKVTIREAPAAEKPTAEEGA